MKAIGKGLPTVSAEESSMAVTAMGGVLMNILALHVAHFPAEKRLNALDVATRIALDAADLAQFSRGTDQEQTNAKTLVRALINQAFQIARDKTLQ